MTIFKSLVSVAIVLLDGKGSSSVNASFVFKSRLGMCQFYSIKCKGMFVNKFADCFKQLLLLRTTTAR